MKKPVRLPTEFHWDQSAGNTAPGKATKNAGGQSRRLSVFSPWYLISRLAVLLILLAVVSLMYLSVRTRVSDPMAAARATDDAATGDLSINASGYNLVSPAEATFPPPDAVVNSETDATAVPVIVASPAPASLCGDTEGKVIGDKIKSAVLGMTLAVDVYVGIMIIGFENIFRWLTMAVIEENKFYFNPVFIGAGQKILNVPEQSFLVLEVDEIVKINPDAVDAVEGGVVKFAVIDDRVVFIPLLGFVDSTGRDKNRTMNPAPVGPISQSNSVGC